MRELQRLAVVNRGEPAMRLLHAVAELNAAGDGPPIHTIALHTDPDADARFVRTADEARSLGPALVTGADGSRTSAYLDYDRVLAALSAARADAVWVGWGFVAEDADFAERCEQAGITFVGPRSDVIRGLGNKIAAKLIAERADVPVLPWSGGPVDDVDAALKAAESLGYPVLVKAAAGGGGRGIRMVADADALPGAFRSASEEARGAFGDATVFLETPISDARHVEVQVIADEHGTAWAVGVRDCSVQRRNQKVMEESASTALGPEAEQRLRDAAVRLVTEAGYTNAGTVEMLLDPSTGRAMFMEVNTRLQVEHTVTEAVTGLDLVKLQLHVARGGRLEGEPPASSGHAIEVRVNAEDPEREFSPTPGTVRAFRIAQGPGIRVDTGITEGDVIPSAFDSMVAKVIAWGRDRGEAIARLDRSLAASTLVVEGGATNVGFLLGLLRHPDVRAGRVTTKWLDALSAAGDHLPEPSPVALLTAAVVAARREQELVERRFHATARRGRPELDETVGHVLDLRYAGQAYRLRVLSLGSTLWQVQDGDARCDLHVRRVGEWEDRVVVDGQVHRVVAVDQGATLRIEVDGTAHRIERDDGGAVRTSSPAVVIAVLVEVGDDVAAGDPVAVVESMKMETTIRAPMAGRVRSVTALPNTQIEAGAVLLQLEPTEEDEGARQGGRVEIGRVDSAGAEEVDLVDSVLGTLRAQLLGYDIPADEAEDALEQLRELQSELGVDDERLLEAQRELLDIFLDLSALSRRRPDEELELEGQGEVVRAPQEHLLTFLRTMDRGPDELPEAFTARLEQTVARYGVEGLEPSAELESALVRLYRSFTHLPASIGVVTAVLEHWLEEAPRLDDDDVRRFLLRLVTASQGRYPTVADLARQVEYAAFEQPRLEAERRATRVRMREVIAQLMRDPGPQEAARLVDELVECPQPLRAELAGAWWRANGDEAARAALLTARLRRYYRIRDLDTVRVVTGRRGTSLAVGGYDQPYGRVHVVMAYADVVDAPAVAGASTAEAHRSDARGRVAGVGAHLAVDPAAAADLRDHLAEVDDDRLVVIDLALRWPGSAGRSADEVAEALRNVVERARLHPTAHRVDVSAWDDEVEVPGDDDGDEPPVREVVHASFRDVNGRLTEERLYRDLHPMLGKRLSLWRLSNFELTRLPSAEDVYLFHAVARENRADERLFALAEVRDLRPVVDDRSQVLALPHFERMLMESLASIRRVQARRPVSERLLWNRVTLFVRPVWEHGPEPLQSLARRLAPATVGLGLQKVVVQARLRDRRSGEVVEADIHVDNPGSKGVVFRVEPPRTTPIATLSAYRQKVLTTHRRGSVYPYEIVKLMTPPADSAASFPPGTFTELDLDRDGRLVEVDRAYGLNRAGVVIGRITNRTSVHPEGMTRLFIAGDPSKSLGSLAEPECRRILAVLDAAEAEQLPVDWFALSSGARIAMDSGTENMDWIGAVLRRLIEVTQAGVEVNVVVTGINVGAQPYWNAEATMLMHCRGVLIMTPESAMVLTGKQALDVSGGVSAEDNLGIGGYERVMGPNGQAQYWAPDLAGACELLLAYHDSVYVVPGERFPRRVETTDPVDRDVRTAPHAEVEGSTFTTVGQVFSAEDNRDRKKPFDIRSVMRAVTDSDADPLERWSRMRNAENAVVWDARIGGFAATILGVESHVLPRRGFHPADGPASWTAGTLFPQSSKKIARAINAASGSRPVVVLANLSGFDGSPESMRMLQLEFGAEIGRAVVNFDGPIIFVVVSRYHGGAFVVFSATLNDHLEVAAVEGSRASVIGGAPAAAVVFARDVRRRVEADSRVVELRERLDARIGGSGDRDEVAERLRVELEEVRATVHGEKLGEVAEEFDRVHDIQRAQEVGSVHHIIPAAELRPYLVDALERGMKSVAGAS